jgi:glyoxylate carboligase
MASVYLDCVPMIAISGQIAARRESPFTHQAVDHACILSLISKWAAAIRRDNAHAIHHPLNGQSGEQRAVQRRGAPRHWRRQRGTLFH